MSDLMMTIGGEAVPTAATFDVINPAKGTAFAQAPECSPEQLDAAFESASKAYRDWRSDEAARRAALLAGADALMAAAGDIAPILTAEQGKPLGEANIEVFGAAIWLQYYANLEIPREVIQDDDNAFAEVVRRPLGVVAAITPWNFPLILASMEDRARSDGGQHDGPEAVTVHAAGHTEAGRGAPGCAARRRLQRRHRWGQPRCTDDRAPGAPQDQLHRVGRDRQEGGGVGRP